MKTKIDNWLRMTFGMRWVVSVSDGPLRLPRRFRVSGVGEGSRRCVFTREVVADSQDDYHELVARLRAGRRLFNARIEDKPGLLAGLVNRRGSLSWSAAWGVCYAAAAVVCLGLVKGLIP